METTEAKSNKPDNLPEPNHSGGSGRYLAVGTILQMVGCLTPLVVLMYLIARYSVNLPFSDQWELVTLIQKSRTSGVEASDLFSQHGEQRMFFPRLVMLALAPLTNWNIRVELIVNVVLAVAIFAVLLVLMRQAVTPLGWWAALPMTAVSLFVFSPVQWENWFWGWQISWFLPLASLLVAVGILVLWPHKRPAWPAIVVAALAAVVGQYSMLSGTLIWVSCLPILLLKKHLRGYSLVWICGAAIATGAYLYRYVTSPVTKGFRLPLETLISEPKRPAAYLLYYLGRPVLDERPSYLAGAIVLTSFCVVLAYLLFYRRDRLDAAAPWIAVGLYCVLAALLTMFGRIGLGLQFAGSSRYTTVGILLLVSTLALITLALLPLRREESDSAPSVTSGKFDIPKVKKVVVLGVWALATTAFLIDYSSEVESMKVWHVERLQIKGCLQSARSPRDPCLTKAYPNPEVLFERVQYLKKIGWGGLDAKTQPSVS